MEHPSKSRSHGFTFIELMVSMALGLIIVGAAVKLFSQGVDATWVVSQRAEMQQDLRAVENMVVKDISLAGAGLPSGQGISLPSGGVSPIYGCDQTGLASGCPPNGGVNYPCASLVGACIPTLSGVIPGFALGIKPPGSPTASDLITVAYSDTIFALNCYTVTFNSPGNSVTLTAPANPPPSSCILPPGLVFPQGVDDPAVGLTPGDLVLFQNNAKGTAIGEVTTVVGAAPTWTVSFANGDPLKINQAGATGDLTQISGFTIGAGGAAGASVAGTVANRIFVITYYIKVNPDPTGATTGTPVLMRQVNGHTAVPAAENIVNMQYTYDAYASDGTLLNQLPDGGESLGVSLNLIRKINIAHLTIRSQLDGARTTLYATNGFQGFDVQTSISARNLSYQNRYSFSH